jgi:hypothetical protein
LLQIGIEFSFGKNFWCNQRIIKVRYCDNLAEALKPIPGSGPCKLPFSLEEAPEVGTFNSSNNLNDLVIILVGNSWSHFVFDHVGIKPAGRRTVWAALIKISKRSYFCSKSYRDFY